MNINERLFQIMDKKHIKNNALAERLNVKPQIITNWKNRGTNPPIEYLPTICEVLNVSWEYLVTGEETEQHFTSEEVYLVEQFRKVLPEGQKNILKYIEFELYKQ